MPQPIFNLPAGAQLSAAITTNTTTTLNVGSRSVVEGYTVTNAGSAWTIQFYNGDPGTTGVAIGPAVTVAVGYFKVPQIRCAQGLYVVTAGTTAGSLQVAYF